MLEINCVIRVEWFPYVAPNRRSHPATTDYRKITILSKMERFSGNPRHIMHESSIRKPLDIQERPTR